MFFIKQLIPFLYSFLFLLGAEFLLLNPSLIYWFAPIIFLAILFSVFYLLDYNWKKTFNLTINPFIFSLSALLYLLVNTPLSALWQNVFIVACSIILFLSLQKINSFASPDNAIEHGLLQNFFTCTNLISAFLFFSAVYSLIFNPLPNFWFLEIAIIVFTAILVYQNFWLLRISLRKNFLFLCVICLIVGEIFFAIYFLPTSYFVNSIILVNIFYLLNELVLNYLLKRLDAKILKRQIVVMIVIFIIIFLTAQWT